MKHRQVFNGDGRTPRIHFPHHYSECRLVSAFIGVSRLFIVHTPTLEPLGSGAESGAGCLQGGES